MHRFPMLDHWTYCPKRFCTRINNTVNNGFLETLYSRNFKTGTFINWWIFQACSTSSCLKFKWILKDIPSAVEKYRQDRWTGNTVKPIGQKAGNQQ